MPRRYALPGVPTIPRWPRTRRWRSDIRGTGYAQPGETAVALALAVERASQALGFRPCEASGLNGHSSARMQSVAGRVTSTIPAPISTVSWKTLWNFRLRVLNSTDIPVLFYVLHQNAAALTTAATAAGMAISSNQTAAALAYDTPVAE